MSQRLIVILAIVGLTLGYTVYEAMKLEKKISEPGEYYKSNSILKFLPSIQLNVFNTDKKVALNELAESGNHLVVHFWATWCAPCEKELPTLKELTEKLKDKKNVKFLFIAVNDKVKDVTKFLKKYNLEDRENILILEDKSFYHQKSFGTYKLPETFVFSSQKSLLKRFVGPQEWDRAEFFQYIRSPFLIIYML